MSFFFGFLAGAGVATSILIALSLRIALKQGLMSFRKPS
jgi:hypothetical protein